MRGSAAVKISSHLHPTSTLTITSAFHLHPLQTIQYRIKTKAVEAVGDLMSLMGKLNLAPPVAVLDVLERALLLVGKDRADLCDSRCARSLLSHDCRCLVERVSNYKSTRDINLGQGFPNTIIVRS